MATHPRTERACTPTFAAVRRRSGWRQSVRYARLRSGDGSRRRLPSLICCSAYAVADALHRLPSPTRSARSPKLRVAAWHASRVTQQACRLRLWLSAPPKIDDQCAVCGAADVKLLRCGRCVELKLASPAGYCSKQCQAAAWPKHKLFHRAARLNDQLTAQAGLNALQTDITLAVTSSSDYLRLCTAAQQRRCESDYRAASKLLKKAIRLEPREPWGYYSLGYTTKGSGAGAEAIPLFVQAASLSEQAPQSDRARFIWVAATTMLFCIWDGPDATGQEYPAWLSDSVAKRSNSARCVEITPLRYSAWYMRGRVLLTGVLDVFEPLRTKLCERADGLGDGVVGLVRGAGRAFRYRFYGRMRKRHAAPSRRRSGWPVNWVKSTWLSPHPAGWRRPRARWRRSMASVASSVSQ